VKRRLALSLSLLALTGCATGTGVKLWAPATWFSHAPADKVDKAAARVTLASDAAIIEAQKAAHETQYALLVAGDSRTVKVASESNDATVTLLDQVAGPLKVDDLAKIKAAVTNLISENAEIRAKAEKERAESMKTVATVSAQLEAAVRDSQTANDALRAAYDRENKLANQLRSQKALLWIAGGFAVLLSAGYIYLRFFLGGMPTAIGSLLKRAEDGHSLTASEIRDHIDTAFHDKPSVLSSIASAYRKTQ